MESLYDDLTAKLEKDPRLTKRSGPRSDLVLLLFNARDSVRELWLSADEYVRSGALRDPQRLSDAVEGLRFLFGERDS